MAARYQQQHARVSTQRTSNEPTSKCTNAPDGVTARVDGKLEAVLRRTPRSAVVARGCS